MGDSSLESQVELTEKCPNMVKPNEETSYLKDEHAKDRKFGEKPAFWENSLFNIGRGGGWLAGLDVVAWSGQSKGQLYRDLHKGEADLRNETKTHAQNYAMTPWTTFWNNLSHSSAVLHKDCNMPRMRNFAENTGDISVMCPQDWNRFHVCAKNLSKHAAFNQCRREWLAYRQCNYGSGNPGFAQVLAGINREVSNALGDYYFDYTSEHYYAWARSTGLSNQMEIGSSYPAYGNFAESVYQWHDMVPNETM